MGYANLTDPNYKLKTNSAGEVLDIVSPNGLGALFGLTPQQDAVNAIGGAVRLANNKVVAIVNPDGSDAAISVEGVNGREVFISGTTVNSISSDNNQILVSNSTSNCTYTLLANICPAGVGILMRGTGSITLVGGAGVTLITSQNQTFIRGDIVYAIPTNVANEFLVKVA